jgi:hypothetical protein
MSQIKRVADLRQTDVENALSSLGIALKLIELDRLRVRQAIERSGLTDLLEPVEADQARIRRSVHAAQEIIRTYWDHGQSQNWET